MPEFRMTTMVANVLREFLEDPSERQYGFELMQRCGISSGSLYPILIRLERAGWIVGQHEEIDTSAQGRPARKYYTLTPEGVVSASRELEKLSARLRPPTRGVTYNPGLAGGFA